jgi:hypothetical protein
MKGELQRAIQGSTSAPVFPLSLHFDRLPGQFCRLLERLTGHYIEHWSALLAKSMAICYCHSGSNRLGNDIDPVVAQWFD